MFPNIITSLKKQMKEKRQYTMEKVFCIVVSSIFIILNANFSILQTSEDFPNIKDRVFDLTVPLNRFLQEEDFIRNFIKIYSSLLMDIQLISYMITYLCYGVNHRMVVNFSIFYAVRGFLQVKPNNLTLVHLCLALCPRLHVEWIPRLPIFHNFLR